MSQQWAREEARARAKARRLQAKTKLTVISETERTYKSPITYTRLQYMQNIARAQNTNYNEEFLPEGEVTDVLQNEWFLILDEAFRIFDSRLVCRKCGMVHDMSTEGVRLRYLRAEMEEADPEYIREVDVEKWSDKFEDIEERYMAELKTSTCWREEPLAKQKLSATPSQMPASAFPSTTILPRIEEPLARKPEIRKVQAKAPKEAEIWGQEALARKATNPEAVARASSYTKFSAQKAPARKTTIPKTLVKTFQTTKTSIRKDLTRERVNPDIPTEISKTVELWRDEVLASMPIVQTIPKTLETVKALADNWPARSAKNQKTPTEPLRTTEIRKHEALERTVLNPKILKNPIQASKVPTSRDLARQRMTFKIPAKAFHTVDVPNPRQVYPAEIMAEEIMAEDSCSEFSWEEEPDDKDEAQVEDAMMGGMAYKVWMEDPLTEVEGVRPPDVDLSENFDEEFNAGHMLERELEYEFALASPQDFDQGHEVPTQSLIEDFPGPRVTTDEIPEEELSSQDSLERELEDAFAADDMNAIRKVSKDEGPSSVSESEQEETMVVYYSSSEESEEE